MLLTSIKEHLRQHTATSLFDMSKRFNVEPEVLRPMLNLLIRKGQVRQCTKTPNCGSKCNKCDVLITEIYEWLG